MNEAQRQDGKGLLLGAAQDGHDRCVEVLLKHGADYSETTRRNSTALMLAARGGHEKCVRTLLKAGTDLNVFDSHDCSALMNAIKYANYGCMDILIEAGAIAPALSEQFEGEYAYKALCCAAENGRHKVLQQLITAGISVNNAPSQYLQVCAAWCLRQYMLISIPVC